MTFPTTVFRNIRGWIDSNRVRTAVLCVCALLPLCVSAKRESVSGTVIDPETGTPVSLASVRVVGSEKGGVANELGKFAIIADSKDSLRFSATGYAPNVIAVKDMLPGPVVVPLVQTAINLSELVVRPHHTKYSKKNNPAYDLMVRVRDDAKKMDPRDEKFYSYDYYDRISLGLNNTVAAKGKKSEFLLEYQDTAINTGLPVIIMSVREKAGTRIHSTDPNRRKEVVAGKRGVGIDEALEQENIRRMLEDVLRETDVHSNDITLMQKRFVSPLGRLAGDFYRYYIQDTVRTKLADGSERRLINLSFAPVNPESFGFNGRLTIDDTDSLKFVRLVEMRVPRVINLNYVDNIFIRQEFFVDSIGKRHKSLDDMSVEIQLIPGTQSFYGHRISKRDGFSYTRREDLAEYYDRLGHVFELDDSDRPKSVFWDKHRLVPLSHAEHATGGLLARLRRNKWFFYGEKVLKILVSGYWEPTENWPVAIGPVNTFASYNSAEGLRLKVGGMTTANLSRHWFGRGYVAYGFHDRKWKYLGEVEYSFTPKKHGPNDFPVNSLRLMHQYDTDMIGQHYEFTNPDNIFLSLKRKPSNLATYRRLSELEYQLELNNHFSVVAGLRHQIQYATPWLPFIDAAGNPRQHYSLASLYVQLRYAPGESFVQGRLTRSPINRDAPIITLTHEYGPKRLFGSLFTLNRTEASAFKRIWMSAFGYLDVILKGGKIWSQVQYPALAWPNANLSYTIQPESYALMNPMEFAMDYYGSLHLTYWGNGVLFNRLPLIKKAKIREVVTFNMLMGGLTKKNNPEYNAELFRFPNDAATMPMGKKPYMEIGVGIDNILTILRVDYVWRLTYRDAPGIDRSGLRIALHFSF